MNSDAGVSSAMHNSVRLQMDHAGRPQLYILETNDPAFLERLRNANQDLGKDAGSESSDVLTHGGVARNLQDFVRELEAAFENLKSIDLSISGPDWTWKGTVRRRVDSESAVVMFTFLNS